MFLMHRVELKAALRIAGSSWPTSLFLMHRVELKVPFDLVFNLRDIVPNAPCGVESIYCWFNIRHLFRVPNAPCGVERNLHILAKHSQIYVPNAPCGVERLAGGFGVRGLTPVPNAPCGVESCLSEGGHPSRLIRS